ncbi:MAG: ATP cone domain-containing protein [Candidatus Jorgensenbacteria bacterium]
MAQLVIKGDGTKEPFDVGKIRHAVEAAAMAAELSGERVAELVRDVSVQALEFAALRDEVDTADLKQIILKELDAVEPLAAQAWRRYDEARGRL